MIFTVNASVSKTEQKLCVQTVLPSDSKVGEVFSKHDFVDLATRKNMFFTVLSSNQYSARQK